MFGAATTTSDGRITPPPGLTGPGTNAPPVPVAPGEPELPLMEGSVPVKPTLPSGRTGIRPKAGPADASNHSAGSLTSGRDGARSTVER